MRAKLISSYVRHTVSFAPDPERPAFGTAPIFVVARVVSELDDIPAGIRHIHFQDVVVNKVRVGDQELTLESGPFNQEHHHVFWTELDAKRLEAQGSDVQVAVPPHLEGQVWVFEPKSRAEQRFAEAAKLSPEEARRQFAEDVSEAALAMSPEETDAYIEKHGLGDIAKPGRLSALAAEAILAEASGDRKQAPKLTIISDRDKDEPETEN